MAPRPTSRIAVLLLSAVGVALAASSCLVVQEGAGLEDGGLAGSVSSSSGNARPSHFDASIRPVLPVDAGGQPDAQLGYGLDSGLILPGPDAGNGSSSSGGTDAGSVVFDGGGGVGCNQWQDCQPHLADPNSAYECVANQCVCDPQGTWAPACAGLNGYFSTFDCFCVISGSSPPMSDPDPTDRCGWEWGTYCTADTYVDTSHYERRCGTVSGETVCEDVWVQSGYYLNDGCSHTEWTWKCR